MLTPVLHAARRKGLRIVAAGLTLVALASLTACSPAAEEDGRPVVLTTFTVLADIARQVAGDELRVESITKVGAEIHGYEPTPSTSRRPRRPT